MDFENTATELAIEKGYQYVICGHIHEPKIIRKENKNGTILYLNSGDWVENLTALEYKKKRWKLYRYEDFTEKEEDLFEMDNLINQQLVASIIYKK